MRKRANAQPSCSNPPDKKRSTQAVIQQALSGVQQVSPDRADEHQQQQLLSTTTAMHTRLGSRLPGRIVTRSKARGGDGISSDTELLSAVLQPQAADPTAASKGDFTRKPAPLVPGQASIPTTVATSARLSVPGSTVGGVAATVPTAAPQPRHQRSHSAGHAPKGSLQLAAEPLSDDLASFADTGAKSHAPLHPETQDMQLSARAAGGLQRRSVRLAAAFSGKDTSGALGSLGRASAAARLQKRAADGSSFPSKKTPLAPAAVAGAAAATAAAATAAAAVAAIIKPAAGAADSADAMDQAARSGDISTERVQPSKTRHVRFAAGPLNPERHRNSTDDGHPASEGALAVPVRRLPAHYGMDLSKGNVLMLEQLLGADCSMSVTRLKRRVGLLPPIRPPRPYANGAGGQA